MALRILAGLALCAASALPAAADGIADCERFAQAHFKKHRWEASAARIERGDSLVENRYDDKVGSQAVSTEFMGYAALTEGSATRRARFVCLHGGKGAVYFGIFPDP
jgi:hypothetical protein